MADIARRTGFAPLESIRREVDRLFQDVAGSFGDEGVGGWSPRADISETDDQYIIRMDAPGLKKEDLQVEMGDGQLSVRGERRSEHEEETETVRRVERSFGQFYRTFPLPNANEEGEVKANLRDGLLKIYVPKRAERKPRQIQISE